MTDPTKTHPLRDAIKGLDGSMKDWTVLSEDRDPFRLDTPSNHRDAAWLREAFGGGRCPDPIHIRRVHYRVFGHPKPNGKQYGGTDWKWLSEKVVKGARWLGYIPCELDRGSAQRRAGVVPAGAARPAARHGRESREIGILLPDADDLKPRADLPGSSAPTALPSGARRREVFAA